jgi:hypothetical protein
MAVVDILIKASDSASKVLNTIGDTGSKAAKKLSDNWVKVGIATAATGAVFEKLARDQQGYTQSTRNMAAATGLTEGQMRKLVLSTADVGFSIEEVLGVMKAGREEGLKGAPALQTYAKFWDDVADASGGASEELASAGVALNAIGIDAAHSADANEALGFIIRDTTQSVGQFLAFVGKAGPQLRAMNLDVNDTAALFGALEQELGLSGRVAKAQFSKAVVEADGDMQGMLDTLGVSTEVFDKYKQKVADSSNVIKEQAANNDRSFTSMQRMEAWAERMKYKYGNLIEVMGSFAPILIAAGPLMKIFSTGYTLVSKFAGGVSTLVSSIKAFGTHQGIVAFVTQGKFGPAMLTAAGKVGSFAKSLGSKAISGFQSIIAGIGTASITTGLQVAGVTLAIGALIAATYAAIKAYQQFQEACKQEQVALDNERLMIENIYNLKGPEAARAQIEKNRPSMTLPTYMNQIAFLDALMKKASPDPSKIGKATPMAKGAIVRDPTLALIGEEGTEAVVPLEGTGGGIMGNIFEGIVASAMSRQPSGNVTHDHTGTIKVEGVNNRGETVAVANIVIEKLQREVRAG